MLKLKQIVKTYSAGTGQVTALKGVDLEFRTCEFVSVLGPSGCGKTTLLNIIGGLDQYTSGDLVIKGTSTRRFRDSDWDSYRNHSVGFVFQSYNLIPHQTVLQNVELALTLSGVSKAERRRRALEVLDRVGLADQVNKKPNQMSGGQMQRVAIARALINDPEILLADEPTGALDTATSVSVMELLKEIASDRLVIMVTHNPELADQYSTRIVRLLDGEIQSDSDPYSSGDEAAVKTKLPYKKPSMSFFTALGLSLTNLMTKKTRTILTAFAGSIGIIGIALILSLSNGLQSYIDRVERDTLSSYPIRIEQQTVDMTSLLSTFAGNREAQEEHSLDRVYTSTVMAQMLNTMMSRVESNDLGAFKTYLEENAETVDPLVTAVAYGYDANMRLYYTDPDGKLIQVSPSTVFDKMGFSDDMQATMSVSGGGRELWFELIDNPEFLASQYDVIAGTWPTNKNEAVLVVDEHNEIPDMALYSLGLKDPDDVAGMMSEVASGGEVDAESREYSYDEILSLEYSLILPTELYEKTGSGWADRSEDGEWLRSAADEAEKIRIVGILRPSEDAVASSANGYIGYTADLSRYVIERVNSSEIVAAQEADPDTDVFTGLPFEADGESRSYTLEELTAIARTLPEEEQASMSGAIEQMRGAGMDDDAIAAMLSQSMAARSGDATYESNLEKLGVCDPAKPASISIYAADFDAKEALAEMIRDYNDSVSEEYTITYTDYVGLLMSSVTTVINAISYVLIAFVSISLVVSSIMIGIITYISVLERTKEIGILRSIGASKRDISRVFNAETITIGFISGALGILVTLLLCLPANAIIRHLTGISNVALLPAAGAVILVIISMLLTFIAGLIPSRLAAKKDPVVALRTE